MPLATANALFFSCPFFVSIFAKILPKDSLIKDTLMNNIRGYMRKSYAVFTNPNYSVDESSKVFKDAVDFFVRLSKKNRAMKDTAKQIAKRDGLPIKQATEKLAMSFKRLNAPCKVIMTTRKLKTLMPSLKPIVPKMLSSGVVYKIQCP